MNTAQLLKGQLWIHFEGRSFKYENPNQKKFGKQKSSAGKTGEIKALMPGKITKLLKKMGDQVEAGEVVMAMEAMKMEYTLKADVAGVIEQLDCKTGDQVSLGKTLFKVKVSHVS